MSTTVELDRAKRIYYNQKAIAAAGVSKKLKYGGLVLDARAPAGLVEGSSIGVIAVTDDVYERLGKDAQYNPALAAIPNGKSFKNIGDPSSAEKEAQVSVQEQIDEDTPSELFFERLETLLGDSLK